MGSLEILDCLSGPLSVESIRASLERCPRTYPCRVVPKHSEHTYRSET